MEQKFCQSCGMPLTEELLGTNADGSKNEDYCIYCYKDGKFLQDCTMDEMIEHCAHQAPPSLGCHFLLQCMKVKSESEVAQSCLTLHDPMDCSLPGSSTHGIFQARVLKWGAIAFSIEESIGN